MEIIQISDRSASVAKRKREDDEDEEVGNSAKVRKYIVSFSKIAHTNPVEKICFYCA